MIFFGKLGQKAKLGKVVRLWAVVPLGGCALRFESCGGKLGAKQKGGEAFRV
ncbi:hypothetical protein RPZ72_000282 [Campylobacter upsaliensis]|nr:hypothetical protein [Campylobacter upsaliensis]